MYIYIYMPTARPRAFAYVGWHYLFDATCVIRPHSFDALFVVSRSTNIAK